MSIFNENENNMYYVDCGSELVLDVFTDSGAYRKPNGFYDTNVAYFIYSGDNLIHCKRKEYIDKTNNFGELKAIEKAYKYIKKNLGHSYATINVYSDSLLSINCLTTFLDKWLKNVRNGVLYTSKNEPVKNQDIIWKIIKLRDYFKDNGVELNIYFVRSHSPESKLEKFHVLYCKDNGVKISIKDYEKIRLRNAICDAAVKR